VRQPATLNGGLTPGARPQVAFPLSDAAARRHMSPRSREKFVTAHRSESATQRVARAIAAVATQHHRPYLEAFKTAEGFAIVAHLYGCDQAKRDKCQRFAQAIWAEVEFPSAPSWWFPGKTTLVVWRFPLLPLPGRRKRARE
jgi:hypothetical protein